MIVLCLLVTQAYVLSGRPHLIVRGAAPTDLPVHSEGRRTSPRVTYSYGIQILISLAFPILVGSHSQLVQVVIDT